jgi:hypothetical protein
VGVDGMIPGAVAVIKDGSSVLGKEDTMAGVVQVRVSPGLITSHIITAAQSYCSGGLGPEFPGPKVSTVRKFLPAPEVRRPVYECQKCNLWLTRLQNQILGIFAITQLNEGPSQDTLMIFTIKSSRRKKECDLREKGKLISVALLFNRHDRTTFIIHINNFENDISIWMKRLEFSFQNIILITM